jgi:hypothetical protein
VQSSERLNPSEDQNYSTYTVYTGGAKKKYTHFKSHVDTLVNIAQAVVRRNQVVTTLSTSCNCRSQTWLVLIFCYRYILSITILIQFFPFLKCVYIFWHPLCVCICVCVCVYIYIYTYIHTHTHIHIYIYARIYNPFIIHRERVLPLHMPPR